MIRKAELEDLDGVMECIEDARKLLDSNEKDLIKKSITQRERS